MQERSDAAGTISRSEGDKVQKHLLLTRVEVMRHRSNS